MRHLIFIFVLVIAFFAIYTWLNLTQYKYVSVLQFNDFKYINRMEKKTGQVRKVYINLF